MGLRGTSVPNSAGAKQLNAIFGTSTALFVLGTSGLILRGTPALDSFAQYSTKPATASSMPASLAATALPGSALRPSLGYFDTRPKRRVRTVPRRDPESG